MRERNWRRSKPVINFMCINLDKGNFRSWNYIKRLFEVNNSKNIIKELRLLFLCGISSIAV